MVRKRYNGEDSFRLLREIESCLHGGMDTGGHTIYALIRGLSSQLKCFKVAYQGRYKTNSYLHQFAMEKWLQREI